MSESNPEYSRKKDSSTNMSMSIDIIGNSYYTTFLEEELKYLGEHEDLSDVMYHIKRYLILMKKSKC